MKVAVEQIKDRELKIQEDISASLWEMDCADISFVDNVHLDCTFIRAGREIVVTTELITYRQITCSRCLEIVPQAVKQRCVFSYKVEGLEDYLEIDKDIREEILLNLPMKVICSPDCKGLCPRCGVNLNCQKCTCLNKEIKAKVESKDRKEFT